ncbi:MAG: ABC transporter substrate-binding protein [Chlorobiales bacterium]|nr:ABC transporter substrate-binding protein [Chlorobiales bacterium]
MNRRDFLKNSSMALLGAPLLKSNFMIGGNKVPLKIGYLPITDHLLMIASARETLKNVEIQPVKFSSWAENAEALKAGAIDAGFLLTPMGLTLRQKGVPIKAVLLGHHNGSVITVSNNGDIKKIEDLKGKTIAVPSPFSTHNILLRKVLSEKGIDAARDLKIVDMPPPEMVVALATGRIHGFIVAEPFGAQAEDRKVGKILVLSKDIWPNHICCVLNVRENVISSNKEAVQEAISGMIRTAAFIESNPAQAAKDSYKILGQKPEIIEKVLTSPKDRITFQNLVPVKADFDAMQNYMVSFGLAKEKVDLAAYLDTKFAERG